MSSGLTTPISKAEGSVRRFDMKLLMSCSGTLLESVEDFITAVDNVLRWGAGPFLKSVVERLGIVAKKVLACSDI